MRTVPEATKVRASKLSVRLTAVVVVFAAVLALAYLLLVHFPLQAKLPGLNTAEGHRVFARLTKRLQHARSDAIGELVEIANRDEIRGLDRCEMEKLLVRLEDMKGNQNFQFFLVMDVTGDVILRPSKQEYEGRSLRHLDMFKIPFGSHEPCTEKARLVLPAIGAPFAPVRLSLIMSVPIFDAAGACIGVLAGGLNLNGPLQRALRKGVSADYPLALLLTSRGNKIGDSGTSIENVGASKETRHPMFRKATDEVQTAAFSHRGVDHFGFVARLPDTDWVLILHSRLGSTVVVAETIVSGVAWLLAIVMVALLIGALLYGSHIVRPIDQLTSSLIHFGETGESTKLDYPRSSGEVGKAIQAFNKMMQERSQSESDLVRQRRELQALAGELVDIEQRTRYEIATNLHDDISQRLAAAKIRMELLVDKQSSGGREKSLSVTIDLLKDCITGASAMTKKLAEPSLRQLGLVKAVQDLVEFYHDNHDVEFLFVSDTEAVGLSEGMADTLYRGVRELLHNVVKHAQATQAQVKMHRVAGNLVIEVEDDGVGLKEPSPTAREGSSGRFGLFSLRERVRQLGGTVCLENRPQEGCRITVEVPFEEQRGPRLHPSVPSADGSQTSGMRARFRRRHTDAV